MTGRAPPDPLPEIDEIDPLIDLVTLLAPTPSSSKLASAAGSWQVARSELGKPFYCAVLEGSMKLAVERREPAVLR